MISESHTLVVRQRRQHPRTSDAARVLVSGLCNVDELSDRPAEVLSRVLPIVAERSEQSMRLYGMARSTQLIIISDYTVTTFAFYRLHFMQVGQILTA